MKRLNTVRIKDVTMPDFSITADGQGLTQGLIMCYLKCRREFMLRLNEWGKESKKITFANGSITHDSLDMIYTHYKSTGKPPSLLSIKAFINGYDTANPSWLGAGHKEEIPKIKAVAYVVVTEYMRYYRKDFETMEIIGAENVFDVIWKGYRLRGKKDLRFRIAGKKWLIETKTMARIDESEIEDKISFDFQSQFYTHAEEVEYKETVCGVIYNVVRNPGHKVGKDETLKAFTGRLRKAVRKDPAHFFKRWSIPYTDADKKEFKKELLYKLDEIKMLLQGKIHVYRNEKNCVTRFQCSFLRACASGKLVGYTKTNKLFCELEPVCLDDKIKTLKHPVKITWKTDNPLFKLTGGKHGKSCEIKYRIAGRKPKEKS